MNSTLRRVFYPHVAVVFPQYRYRLRFGVMVVERKMGVSRPGSPHVILESLSFVVSQVLLVLRDST